MFIAFYFNEVLFVGGGVGVYFILILDLFYKVIGLISTQVKAHRFLGMEEKLGKPINSWCNSELFT